MNKNKTADIALEIVTALVLFLFIVSFSVTFTLNFRPLYYMDIDFLQIEQRSGLPKEEIKANYDVLIDYNSLFGGVEELNFPTLAMSETGRIHFEEVKVLFVFFQWAAIVCFALGCVLIWLNHKQGNYKFWKYTGIMTVAIPAVLGILMAINWNMVFVMFHKIVFNNDYWIFDASTDPVIMILPDSFFFHCAAMILFCVIMGSILSFMIYGKLLRRKRQSFSGTFGV